MTEDVLTQYLISISVYKFETPERDTAKGNMFKRKIIRKKDFLHKKERKRKKEEKGKSFFP